MRAEAHDRRRLEELCRYITRPALSDERVQVHSAGQVKLKLRMPWCDVSRSAGEGTKRSRGRSPLVVRGRAPNSCG
ncbi:MAG: transposase [Burkholderiaceae bacterium]|nr:transposase [Burkholderiaceae bacterium]